jgi:hypothetical protein
LGGVPPTGGHPGEFGMDGFFEFNSKPFKFKNAKRERGPIVESNSMIIEAVVRGVCVKSDDKFSFDISLPDSKLWFILDAVVGRPATNVSKRELVERGPKLKLVLLATDGEHFVPVKREEAEAVWPGMTPSPITGYRVAKPAKKGFWGRFGPLDKQLVNALIKRVTETKALPALVESQLAYAEHVEANRLWVKANERPTS